MQKRRGVRERDMYKKEMDGSVCKNLEERLWVDFLPKITKAYQSGRREESIQLLQQVILLSRLSRNNSNGINSDVVDNKKKKKTFISFAGPIGAGKSIALEKIVPHLKGDWYKIPEPLEEVLPLLTEAYKSEENAKLYNLRTQLMFFNVRIKATRSAGRLLNNSRQFISERTVFDDIIFWETQKRTGKLRDGDDKIYQEFWKHWVELLEIDGMIPDLFVYLRPDDEECWRRIQERNRPCEKVMKKSYTITLNEEHDKIYLQESGYVKIPGGRMIPVLVFNDGKNYRDNEEVAKEYATRIMQTLEKIN